MPGINLDACFRGGCDEFRRDLLSTEPNPDVAELGGQPPSASWFALVSLAITESQLAA